MTGAEEEEDAASSTKSFQEDETEKDVPKNDLPLAWTQFNDGSNIRPIRYPSDVIEYSNNPEQTYLEIIGTSGQKITNMGKDLYKTCSPNLTHLIFRSHVIKKIEGIKDFKKLELFELYDNQIEYLDELGYDASDEQNAGETIKTLDMSYNVIRDMEPVRFCPNLVDLYLANNKIKVISGLEHLTNLRKIDLGANRIRKIDPDQFANLVNLEELWLGKNKIEKIEGLSNLKKLRRLDVQSNRLTSVENLIGLEDTLEELYLAHNGIDDAGAMCPSGLMLNFKQLTTLDLSKNRLTTCKPFAHLTTLNELWVSSNNIADFKDVEPISVLGTRDDACLQEIYMEHNPIYNDFEYRIKLKEIIPSLVQIDANVIGATGYGSVLPKRPEDVAEEMRLIQDKVVQRAKEEKERKDEEV